MTQTKAELLQTRHQGDIRLGDANSSHYVGFKAPATVSTSLVWTLPAADGTANYLLKTDGSGNLGWVADSTTDSTKMPLAGGTFTGSTIYNDNIKSLFGTGSDLEVYHNGQHSFIKHLQGSGNFFIESAANIAFKVATNESALNLNSNGSVELYHNNVKKFETSSGGAVVQGQIGVVGNGVSLSIADGGKAAFGDGDDLKIYHDGTHSHILNTTGDLKIKDASAMKLLTNSLRLKNADDDETYIAADDDGAVEVYYDNVKKLETDGNGINVIDNDSTVEVSLTDSNGAAGHVYGNSSSGLIALLVGNGETSVAGYQNGATQLFHDNVKKFETSTSGVTVTGTVSDSIGELRQIPQRSVSSVTLAASDVGKAVLATSTVTVPNGVFSSGDAVTIINNSGSDITISKGISTMYLASDGSSANRTLATRGMATIWFSSSSVAYISGAGLS